MKILVLINSIDVSDGGTSRSSTSVIAELTKCFPHLQITLLTLSTYKPVLTSFNRPNVQVCFSRGIASAIIKNYSIIRDVDVVHVQGLWSPFPTFLGIITKFLSGAKLIVSPRGMLEPWSLQQGRIKKKVALRTYQGLLFRLTDVFHVTAIEEAKSLTEVVQNNKNTVIPNGIDISSFVEAHHVENRNDRTILFLSRIHAKKGIEMLIEAWSSLYQNWPNWKVRIIGDGDSLYIESLKTLILSKNIGNIAVEDPVYKEDKVSVYATSDLFVLPTYSENFGIVIAEALSSGLPVITTTGTPWSQIEENHCGELIEPSVNELLPAMQKWMEYSAKERKEAGLRGKRLVERKYSIHTIAQSFYDLYADGGIGFNIDRK